MFLHELEYKYGKASQPTNCHFMVLAQLGVKGPAGSLNVISSSMRLFDYKPDDNRPQ